MRQVMSDRNDRLRMVAYAWFEHHRDVAVLPALIDALEREQSEFVRPALLRALAAYGDDPRARSAVLPLVMRGQDYFRGALIDALGDYRGAYAVSAISEVAKLDGPLQDDAVTALGKIGDGSTRTTCWRSCSARRRARRSRRRRRAVPARHRLRGARGLLEEVAGVRAEHGGYQPLLRGAAHGLAVLARAKPSGRVDVAARRGRAGHGAGARADRPCASASWPCGIRSSC